jgi:uncharacterized protein
MSKVLYLYGGWPGHKPYEVADWAIAEMETLGLDIVPTVDPFVLEEDLTGYDLIVLGWTQALTTENMTKRQEQSLLHAVSLGTGVAGWHGMTASFRSSLPYNFVIGGSFIEHPGGEGSKVPYRVTITDRDHIVTRSVEDFDVASEQYYMHVDPSNHVLAETEFSDEYIPWLKGIKMPVAWVRPWGMGRVFYCTVGHTPEDLRDEPVSRLMRQGIEWAVRGSQKGDS